MATVGKTPTLLEMADDLTDFEAAKVAEIRAALPTWLGSAELRDGIAADIRARSVFAARLGNLTVISKVKEVADAMAAGKMDLATGRLVVLETLRAVQYTPEGGFPDAPPGSVPPAVRGSLQDLTSLRRLNLILKTQLALVRGRGQQIRGMQPERLQQFPAYELVRGTPRRAPRKWGGKHDGTPPRRGGQVDPRPRWIIAGGRVTADGRMIALKGDPVFGELGSSGNFDDALDVDFSPFAIESGMVLKEVPRSECDALRITGPNGETVDEWLAMDHPLLLTTQVGIPAPQGSIRDLDPGLVAAFEKSAGIRIVETTATTPGNEDEVRRRIAERRAAREARRASRLETAVARADAAYAAKGGGQ